MDYKHYSRYCEYKTLTLWTYAEVSQPKREHRLHKLDGKVNQELTEKTKDESPLSEEKPGIYLDIVSAHLVT